MTFTLWRATNAGDTRTTVPTTEKVVFSYGIAESNTLGIIHFHWEIPNRRVDVPNPDTRSLAKPDTGIAPILLVLDIVFNQKTTDVIEIKRLAKFALGNQTVRNLYKHGRFGVFCDEETTMNLNPTATSGFKIQAFSFDDMIAAGGGYATGKLVLEFSGDVNDLLVAIGDV